MSKKKRKTRKEKEVVKHAFQAKAEPSSIAQGATLDKEDIAAAVVKSIREKVKSDGVPNFVFADLNKVFTVIAVIFVTLAVLTFLIYKTHLFIAVLGRFGLKF